MIPQPDTPIEFAKEFIRPRVMWSKPDWFGPVAYVLLYEFRISYYGFELYHEFTSAEQVSHGKNCSIPTSNIRLLVNAASIHKEAYQLACSLAADFLDGDERLPEELKVFVTARIRDVIKSPLTINYQSYKLPTPATFLRDRAIYDTADAVSAKFGLPPTGNASATEVAVRALNAVRLEMEEAGLRVTISTNVTAGAAVAERYKMPTNAELHERVTAILRDFKGRGNLLI